MQHHPCLLLLQGGMEATAASGVAGAGHGKLNTEKEVESFLPQRKLSDYGAGVPQWRKQPA